CPPTAAPEVVVHPPGGQRGWFQPRPRAAPRSRWSDCTIQRMRRSTEPSRERAPRRRRRHGNRRGLTAVYHRLARPGVPVLRAALLIPALLASALLVTGGCGRRSSPGGGDTTRVAADGAGGAAPARLDDVRVA